MGMAVQPPLHSPFQIPNALVDASHLPSAALDASAAFFDPRLCIPSCPSGVPGEHSGLPLPRKRPRGDDACTSGRISPDEEIDALVRLHGESLRAALEQHTRRHCREVLLLALRAAQRSLREKEVELDAARRRAAELESRALQVAAEGQIWFHVARNSETLAASLRAALEQAAAGVPASGDLVEDEESCCDETAIEEKKGRCRACGERESFVLILPCRHLCLCSECDRTVDTCPICCSPKGGSLEVLLS